MRRPASSTCRARRPRERLLEEGAEQLGDAELVAVLLGTGRVRAPVAVLAAALLEEVGGLSGLARAGPGALLSVAGLGGAKAARLAAAVELGRRALSVGLRAPGPALPDSRAVHSWARPRLASLDHEELWLLALDGRSGLRSARRIGQGGLSGVHASTRDVIRWALRDGAAAFVLVHNHPSGDPQPSGEDVAFTARAAAVGEVVGTPLVDHVVVARGGYVSMLDCGLLPPAPSPRAA
jgi:DNA repair protein RadC